LVLRLWGLVPMRGLDDFLLGSSLRLL
jgi:hypothetical protein